MSESREPIMLICVRTDEHSLHVPSRVKQCSDCKRDVYASLLSLVELEQREPHARVLFCCSTCSQSRLAEYDEPVWLAMPSDVNADELTRRNS